MTTRPSVSVGRQPPPQRSVSTTIPISRPSLHQRSLSQQYTASSPTRRGTDGFAELTVEGDAAQGGRPRLGMSRLRVEISTDSKNPELVESPKPVSATTALWRPGLPPRGRPQLHFDVPSVSNLSQKHAQEGGFQDYTTKPMPFPVRPGNHLPEPSKKFQPSPSSTVKKDARPKPYALEVPSAAPHYTPNGHADFFPWTGNHPEDQFSEPVIRQGYYDKAQMTQNETGSARPSIFPALKHKTGLQTLSSIFTNILAQRRAHGQITTTSTFKPPPRVTVTDTKREMWLKDLANPTISLRRLSRSIPHGIRGKVLLDQSLSKNIPIERAVWLAKCVGANELRSFRRKGVSGAFAMGGEAKWIRDYFTVHVEQFLESIVGSCGEKDFKTRINYAIRLATYFHAESLLDREHYTEWLVSSLENSPQAKLPVWLLVTQIYWRELLQYRKHGRRLSTALLKQLNETLNHIDSDLLVPLSDRLKVLIKELIVSNPESFVAPTIWPKYKQMIFSDIDCDDDHFIALLRKVDARNCRLIPPNHKRELPPRRRLIDRLDETLRIPLTNDISTQCWNLDDDKSLLIQTILEWSTSSYRPGATKVFVAARILRTWSKFGADITGEILNVLDSTNHETGRSRSAFYHLVSELSRSEHFLTPRYFQWLIARGGVDGPEAVALTGPCATRLLAELPAHNLSESMYDLRMTLLSRADFSVDEEENIIEQCVAFISRRLPDMQSNMDVDSEDVKPSCNMEEKMSSASRACKSELGYWLRQQVKLQIVQPALPFDEWDKLPTKGGTSAVTAADFNTIRTYLELMDDFSMLADILKIVSSSNDPDVLASCANTLDLHIETFAAIGALNGLFDILLGRLQSLTEDTDSAPRVFLVALLDLSSRLSSQKVVSQQLAHELARSDRKNAADACSPVSDQMAMVQDAEADFTDEIEKVLATGNIMEQATLERLFQSVTTRLEETWEKLPEQQRSCGLLLTRLRTFDVPQFDVLMGAWVQRLVQMERRPSLIQVCSPLISFGCLSLHSVIRSCRAAGEMESKGAKNSHISLEAFTLLTSTSSCSDVMSNEDTYRFRIKQAHTQKDFSADLLEVIRQAFESQNGTIGGNVFKTKGFQELLQSLALLDTEALIDTVLKPLLHCLNPDVVAAIEASVDDLLLPSHQGLITTEKLFDLADDLSLPFCQMKLTAMLRAENNKMEDTEDSPQNRFEAFDTAIESAVTAGRTSWASIIPLLDPAIAQYLRQRAETRLLSLIPTPRTISGIDLGTMQSRIILAENLSRIIHETSNSISSTPATTTSTSDLAMSLNGLWLLLANSQSQEIKELILSKWIPLLLSFVTIQAPAFEATKAGHESRAKTTLALAAIFLQLQAQDIGGDAIVSLTEQTFDLALYLVDVLPEEVRMQCVRSLRDTTPTPQIYYLFSFAGNASEGLILSQKGADGKEKTTPFTMRRWEMLGEPTPNVGENDTSLSLTLFGARRG